jgi:hypothetical protein
MASLLLWKTKLPANLQPLPDYEAVFIPIGAGWASYLFCVYNYVQMVIFTPDFIHGIETNDFSSPYFRICVEAMTSLSRLIRGYLIHSPVFHLMPLFLPHCILYGGVMHCIHTIHDMRYHIMIDDHIRALDIIASTYLPRFRIESERLKEYSLFPELAIEFLREKCSLAGLYFST